jgi:hypothetical protein
MPHDANTRHHVDKRTARIANRDDFMAHISLHKNNQAITDMAARELTAIYAQFNPDKVPAVTDLVLRYKGKEEELLSNVRAKYGVREGDITDGEVAKISHHQPIKDKSIVICARKRPLFEGEQAKGEYDVVSCDATPCGKHPVLTVHNATMRPDMKNMYLKNHKFSGFDHVFTDQQDTMDLYNTVRCIWL